MVERINSSSETSRKNVGKMAKDSSISFFNDGFPEQCNLAVDNLFPQNAKGGGCQNYLFQLKLPCQVLIFNKPIRLSWSG